MEFRTILNLPESNFKINHQHKILCVGSCFSDHIGQKLLENKFQVLVNPFGTCFNPITISTNLLRAHDQKFIEEGEMESHQNRYFHYDYHSSFSHSDSRVCLANINKRIQDTYNWLKECDVLIITIGTSFVYKKVEDKLVVGNCHKVPADRFHKSLLSVNEVIDTIHSLIRELKAKRKNLKIIITVSPVRHLKDGLIENGRSKAILLESVHQIIDSVENTFYFPAYEWMIDDLRDYRFYNEDMIHPSPQAVSFIWEHFCNTYFAKGTIEAISAFQKIQKMIGHRPISESETEKDVRLSIIEKKKKELLNLYPFFTI